MMEEHGSNIVEVAVEGEKTSPGLVGPNFDLVVVASGNEQRLRFVKVDTSHRSVVLLESINERSHPVIPQLYGRRMKRHENPWSSFVSRCSLVG